MSQGSGAVVIPTHEFGDTSPCRRIAEKHGVSYDVVLKLVDFMLHDRKSQLGTLPSREVINDCAKVANRTAAQHMRARLLEKEGRLVFRDGAWRELPT